MSGLVGSGPATAPDAVVPPADDIVVTGQAQQDAWRRQVLPPVEQLPGGVSSVPVPITGSPLRYTLCYVLDGRRGPVLIDPGWPDDVAWDALVEGLGSIGVSVSDVHGVLVSHAHSDHHGLAGRVRDAAGCWIGMHADDIEILRRVASGRLRGERNESFLDIVGAPVDDRPAVRVGRDWMQALARTLPDRVIDDGARDLVPGRSVTAHWTPGHTPGHLCFVDEDHDLVFSGDHLLPRITSHVGGYRLADEDVLGQYLDSLRSMEFVTDTAEILPAHEYRFTRGPARIARLEQHHAQRLAEVVEIVAQAGCPTVWDVAMRIEWSRGWDETRDRLRRLALAETLAHLRHLETTGRLRRVDGVPARWTTIERTT